MQTQPNRLLFDFYLSLLAIKQEPWRSQNQSLYNETLYALAKIIHTDMETIRNICERMAAEDARPQ
jgi:hypothetical protein